MSAVTGNDITVRVAARNLNKGWRRDLVQVIIATGVGDVDGGLRVAVGGGNDAPSLGARDGVALAAVDSLRPGLIRCPAVANQGVV